MSFSKKWQKLSNPEFTTFRYPRADKNWFVGEFIQVWYKQRSPQREKLGVAEITKIEQRELDPDFARKLSIPFITNEEAIADGFENYVTMIEFMEKQYGLDYISLFNKLTIKWVSNSD